GCWFASCSITSDTKASPSTRYPVPSTQHPAPSTQYSVSPEHSVQSSVLVLSTGYWVPSTRRRRRWRVRQTSAKKACQPQALCLQSVRRNWTSRRPGRAIVSAFHVASWRSIDEQVHSRRPGCLLGVFRGVGTGLGR